MASSAQKRKEEFDNQLLVKQGEYVDYYSYSNTYSDGYLIERTEPTPTRVLAIITTHTQRDKQEFDVGNYSIGDQNAYLPTSITPTEQDELTRLADGERYRVKKIVHEGRWSGVRTFTKVHITRITNVSRGGT